MASFDITYMSNACSEKLFLDDAIASGHSIYRVIQMISKLKLTQYLRSRIKGM